MADVWEKDLAAKSSLTTSDFIRVVGSDNVSYKQGFSSVADLVKTVTTAIINGTDTNLNNYTTTNVYHFDTTTSTMTNAPATGTYFSGFLFVDKYQSNKVLQRFFYSGAEKSVWVRMLWNGTWSAWVKEPTRAEVDALNSNRKATNTYSLAACQTLKNNWSGYPTGFSTTTCTSNGPVFMAMIYKVSADYGCAILMTYGSDQQTTPIFIQLRQGTWNDPISLR